MKQTTRQSALNAVQSAKSDVSFRSIADIGAISAIEVRGVAGEMVYRFSVRIVKAARLQRVTLTAIA